MFDHDGTPSEFGWFARWQTQRGAVRRDPGALFRNPFGLRSGMASVDSHGLGFVPVAAAGDGRAPGIQGVL